MNEKETPTGIQNGTLSVTVILSEAKWKKMQDNSNKEEIVDWPTSFYCTGVYIKANREETA